MGWVHATMVFAILRATNLLLAWIQGKMEKWTDMAWMMELASLIILTDVVLLFSKSVHFAMQLSNCSFVMKCGDMLRKKKKSIVCTYVVC